jgi:hypothetical protein
MTTLLETRELFVPQERYIHPVEATGSLPAATETAIRVPRDYSVSLFFASTVVNFNSVSNPHKTVH